MYEFKLPDLGEGIHEGEILKWHVAVGAQVEEDAPLVEVETDKAAVTIPSPAAGTVTALGAQVGEMVTVGTVIAVIDGAVAGDVPEAPRSVATGAAVAGDPPAAAQPAPSSAPRSASRPVPAAPATRRLARELGVDLHQVTATGPAGRVTPEDVQRHAARLDAGPGASGEEGSRADAPLTLGDGAGGEGGAREAQAQAEVAAHTASTIPFLDLEPLPDFSRFGPVEREPLRSIRRRVAHRMVTSKILVPHVAHMDEADVTLLEEFRHQERERRPDGPPLTLLAFVVKAVTAGLRAAPAFNASLDPFREEILYKQFYNIGIAADTGRGLVVPVIRGTDRRSIIAIAEEIDRLARAARAGSLEAEEMRGGTFTITNVGPLGGTALIPAINYPEVAILGMGRAQQKPVVRDGEVVVRTILPLTLAFDHRIADGADAARFVSELVRHLSDPRLLLLET